MPKAFDDMVNAVKKSLKSKNPNMSDKDLSSKAYAIATDRWKKSHGGKALGREMKKDWRLLEFFVPITESVTNEEDEFIIKGVAINETTTLNNVKYVAEELEKAAPTFRDVPILLDHKNEVKNIVGRTTENVVFNHVLKRIDFEAKIMDKDIRERITDGRIKNVSIGAMVSDLKEQEDGSVKAIGVKGLELSMVAVPGDSQANLAHALEQGLVLKEKAKWIGELNMEEDFMAEEETQNDEASQSEETAEETSEESNESEESSEAESEEESKEEPSKESTSEEKVSMKAFNEMKKEIAGFKELLMEKKKIKEAAKKTEEKMVDNTKGVVSDKSKMEEALDLIDSEIIERVGNNKYGLFRDYKKESVDSTSLKRLVRQD